MPKVEIYTKDYCPYCTKAKTLLDRKDVDYKEIDITHDPNLQMGMIEKSGGRRTVPQIFIGGQAIGGCDDLYALEEKGELDKLLNAA